MIIACAEYRSFAAAAVAMGIDQTTVSRRISNLEAAIGRPLFTRRRSGATPTPAGEALLERARAMAALADDFEGAMHGLKSFETPKVTLAASEGLLTYTLIPALMGQDKHELPLDRSMVRSQLPKLAFSTAPAKADISIMATSPGDLPRVSGAVHVRRVGTMNFVPVASRDFLHELRGVSTFDDLADLPLLDIGIYRAIRGLDAWNGLVAAKDGDGVSVAPNTPKLQRPLLGGGGGVDSSGLFNPLRTEAGGRRRGCPLHGGFPLAGLPRGYAARAVGSGIV
ncbi:Transcriptional regulator LysR family [Paramagnetospirillum magnetotacticum MS-1]|uniref:Transcriptional regulator LysR family n=1 Tax=Paramagnetospirillum magnetotacticum MS-1 TaxID=272627 RepID=A0A0C2YGV5_PARME|nr:Transcriptional regulator LysR family [Paramagnetospirillum magnetotacticum MS-1]